MGLPEGTVTLLLADVEGSTRLWEQRRTEMPSAVAALNEVVDRLIAQHNGVRPVEQGEGDSFVAAFSSAADAVACASALQKATSDGLLRLRIGVHTGDVHRRDEGNYAGPAVNRTARIRDAGHGGQTLLSQVTADIVGDDLPPGASVVELGERRLRDLGRPERIHQLNHVDLRSDFPPLRGLDSVRNNLPVQLSSFVGRADEKAALHSVLETDRAVTLTGAGGCGKTRLALHVAAELTDAYPGGVWLVDFAPVSDPGALVGAVADAIEAEIRQARGELDAVVNKLASNGATLMIFDNCEHVIAGCAALADALLHRCETLTILSTSREPLGIVGEVTFRVPSLEELDAVSLFVERATRANARFVYDDSNAAVVTEICQRLDGIPLALELAAARLRVFTAGQIRDGLHDRFRLLTGGARTAVPRQQTLQASVDWSYALLLDSERDLLHRLSVFAGRFALEAAQSVGSGAGLEPHHVVDVLAQLVDKSLVVSDPDDPAGRYYLLETVRQYAAARLVEAGDADDVRQRHFEYYFGVTQRRGETVDEFRGRVELDYDNIRRALQWADGQDDPASFVRLAARMYGYWTLGRRIGEGYAWLGRAVERANTPSLRSRVLGHYAHVTMMLVNARSAKPLAVEAVALARELGDPRRTMWALMQLGNVFSNTGDIDEAEECFLEATELASEQNDESARAFALFQLGRQLSATDTRRSREPLEAAIAAARASGAEYIERMSVACLGIATWTEGETEHGIRLLEEGIAALRDSGERWFTAGMLSVQAFVLSYVGRDDQADAALDELRAIYDAMPEPGVGDALALGSGMVAFARGRWDEAVDFLERLGPNFLNLAALIMAHGMRHDAAAMRAATEPWRQHPGLVVGRFLQMADALIARAEGDLERAEESAYALLAGSAGTVYEPVYRFEVLKIIGALAADSGSYELAVRVLASAEAQARAFGASTESGLWRALADPINDAAREALPPDRFAELWAEGATLRWDELLEYVQRGRGHRKKATHGWGSLTKTEHQVVALVAEGLPNRAIAAKLFMSVPTVKSHLTHTFAKLGISSRTELAALAAGRASAGANG